VVKPRLVVVLVAALAVARMAVDVAVAELSAVPAVPAVVAVEPGNLVL
jgi:hypothetical protein